MENIIKHLIYTFIILQMITGSLFIISGVKTGEEKIKSYIVWKLNLFMALVFFIVLTGNTYACLTVMGYVILCIGEIMILTAGLFLHREWYISKKKSKILKLNDESIELYDWEKEYEKIVKYKEKLGYMRHELVKYISLFEAASIMDKEIKKRLNDLKRQMQGVTEIIYCENKIIHAVLEKKLTDIAEREIRVETDIKLVNTDERLLKEICMIIWLLIENIAGRLHRENEIYIKFSEKITKNGRVYISYYIETDKDNVRLSAIKRSDETNLLKELMNKTEGSIILLKKEGKVVETGIFLGGGRNGMKRKLLLCMIIEILCFLYAAMESVKRGNREILSASIFLIGVIVLINSYIIATYSQSLNNDIYKKGFVSTQIKKANIDIMEALKKKEKYFAEEMQFLCKEIFKSHEADDNEGNKEILKLLFESRKKHAENINVALDIKWNGTDLCWDRENLQSKKLQSNSLFIECRVSIWDIGHIFLNLLDNALEAAEKNPPENRWIKLRADLDDNYVFMEIENPYKGELKILNGEIKTTKEDEGNHGMGLKIVREISEKYGMTMEVCALDNIFRVRVHDGSK